MKNIKPFKNNVIVIHTYYLLTKF